MSTIQTIKQEIADKINQALDVDLVEAASLVYPPNQAMGDISLPCFELAKALRQSPTQVAQTLVSNIGASPLIAGTKTAGAYFNITLNTGVLASQVLNEIKATQANYGCNDHGGAKKIMIEYSNVNTHKEYHVGHLRNICYGDAVNHLLTANGYQSIPVSYVNDFGIHVAKTLWGLEELFRDAPLPANKGAFLGKVYARASGEAKDNDIAKRLIEMTMKQIESRTGPVYEQWQKTRLWSIEQFAAIYADLGVTFVHTFYESEYIEAGLKIVEDLKEKGILTLSEGAYIADLEAYGLGVQVIVRSDGTALYAVADLALASEKFKKFQPDVSIYLTDIRQSLHFKQLFKILELMGAQEELVHLGYDFVKLPSGMMSSRSGNVITYEELKQACLDKAVKETRERHSDWSAEKIEKVSQALAFGAIKFEMVKVSAKQSITFDIEKALSFSGYTAAYLQYAYARISSVFGKAKLDSEIPALDVNCLEEDKEHTLLLSLAKYTEAVAWAGDNYDPAEIAKFLFELAQQFNDYYHAVPVLVEDEDIKLARLALLSAVQQVLKNGLNLLGINVIEEM